MGVYDPPGGEPFVPERAPEEVVRYGGRTYDELVESMEQFETQKIYAALVEGLGLTRDEAMTFLKVYIQEGIEEGWIFEELFGA